MTMRFWCVLTTVMLLCVAPAQASDKDWQTASDVALYGLVATSLGVPLAKGDTQGALQAGGSYAATSLLTLGAKEAFPKLRPDGSDRKSMPSGHTSRAFAAAATLYNRQGESWGIPAFAVAGFVGLARVEGRKHYWSDVAVGAALGTVTGLLITRERPDARAAQIVPWGDSKGGGVSLSARF